MPSVVEAEAKEGRFLCVALPSCTSHCRRVWPAYDVFGPARSSSSCRVFIARTPAVEAIVRWTANECDLELSHEKTIRKKFVDQLMLCSSESLRAVMQAHADPPDVGALLDAVEAGNVDRARELLDGGDVGVNDSDEQASRHSTAQRKGETWRLSKCSSSPGRR